MKPPNVSWRSYLLDGIQRMEGTHEHPPWAGRRWLTEANSVFEDCAAQTEDRAVQIEARYRRSQCAHYLGQTKEAETWMNLGDEVLDAVNDVSPLTRAQSLLLKSVILQSTDHMRDALDSAARAWIVAPQDEHRLRGDIANRRARLSWDDAYSAMYWMSEAVREFSAVAKTDATLFHALATAQGRLGIAAQRFCGYRDPRAHDQFRCAENLFATLVRDPCVRKTYWLSRARQAFVAFRPQALWFLLRSLRPAIACWRQLRR